MQRIVLYLIASVHQHICTLAHLHISTSAHQFSVASNVMFVFISLEMGQLAFASSTSSSNLLLSRPGTVALTTRWLLVTTPFSSVTVALVSILPGVKPAPDTRKLSFMVK